MRNGPSIGGTPRLAAFLLLAMVLSLTCWLPVQVNATVHVAPHHEHSAVSPGEPGHVGACEVEAARAAARTRLPVPVAATLTDISSPSPQGSSPLAGARETRPRVGTPPLFLLHAALLI